MRFLFFPLFAVASFNIAKGDTSCFPDQKLTSEGNCIDCDYCPSGEGVDLKEKILVNEDGIALECRTCKPCPDGYWNEEGYKQMSCMKCRLKCFTLNREVSAHCGGLNRGQCGACISSEYEDVEHDVKMPCLKRSPPVTSHIRYKVMSEDHIFSKPATDASTSRISRDSGDSDSQTDGKPVVLLLTGALLSTVLFITLSVIVHYLWKKKKEQTVKLPLRS